MAGPSCQETSPSCTLLAPPAPCWHPLPRTGICEGWGGQGGVLAASSSSTVQALMGSHEPPPPRPTFHFLFGLSVCLCPSVCLCSGWCPAPVSCLCRVGAPALSRTCFSPDVVVPVAPQPLCPSCSPQPHQTLATIAGGQTNPVPPTHRLHPFGGRPSSQRGLSHISNHL